MSTKKVTKLLYNIVLKLDYNSFFALTKVFRYRHLNKVQNELNHREK